MGGNKTHEQSFAHTRFDEAALRDDYGLAPNDETEQRANNSYFDIQNIYEVQSDNDHYQKQIKQTNLIELFLKGIEVDKYITTHMYGDAKNTND